MNNWNTKKNKCYLLKNYPKNTKTMSTASFWFIFIVNLEQISMHWSDDSIVNLNRLDSVFTFPSRFYGKLAHKMTLYEVNLSWSHQSRIPLKRGDNYINKTFLILIPTCTSKKWLTTTDFSSSNCYCNIFTQMKSAKSLPSISTNIKINFQSIRKTNCHKEK